MYNWHWNESLLVKKRLYSFQASFRGEVNNLYPSKILKELSQKTKETDLMKKSGQWATRVWGGRSAWTDWGRHGDSVRHYESGLVSVSSITVINKNPWYIPKSLEESQENNKGEWLMFEAIQMLITLTCSLQLYACIELLHYTP